MIEKYCDSIIPEVAVDEALASALQDTVNTADSSITALDFQGGINAMMDFCKRVNGYVTEEAPWVLAKDVSKKEELDRVLYNTIESVRALAVLLHPVMPATTTLLWESIGAQETMGDIANQRIGDLARWGQLPPGSRIKKGAVLFPRLEEKA